jgi:type II secretory pathway component PulF
MKDLLSRIGLSMEFGVDARERFYTKIGQLMSNGVNLELSLTQLEKNALRRKQATLPKFYSYLKFNIANGINFGQALSPYVPTSEGMMIETGSNTGRLADALANTVTMLQQQRKLTRAIVGSLSYPVLLFVMLILALYLVSVQIIPVFTQVLPMDQWEGLSLKVANASIFIRSYGLYLLLAMFGFIALVMFSLPNWTGKGRLLVENVFPWSIYRLWQGSAFLLAISSLMTAGVKLDELSLAKIGNKASPYLKQRIDAIKRQMIAGMNLGEAMARTGYDFPDVDIVDDILIYARLRGFDQSLYRITQRWIDDLIINITGLMKGINTLMLFLVSIVIGALIMSFYDLFQMINQQTNQ